MQDTVGCGDSFAAAVVLGYIRGHAVPPVMALANAVRLKSRPIAMELRLPFFIYCVGVRVLSIVQACKCGAAAGTRNSIGWA